MTTHGPRLEFAVGAFLLLALASLLVLAIASTNGKFGFSRDHYELKARFTNLGQLRQQAPVKMGGVVIGQVAGVELDPVKYDAIVTLAIDNRFRDLPADTSAGILTGGLLGERNACTRPLDMSTFTSSTPATFFNCKSTLYEHCGQPMPCTHIVATGRSPTAPTATPSDEPDALVCCVL